MQQKHPYELSAGALRLELHEQQPFLRSAVYQDYTWTSRGQATVLFYKEEADIEIKADLQVENAPEIEEGKRISYSCTACSGSEKLATFSLSYELASSAFTLKLSAIRETGSCRMLAIELPGLIATHDPKAQIIWVGQGKVLDASQTEHYVVRWNVGTRLSVPHVALLTSDACAIIEPESVTDDVAVSIDGTGNEKTTSLGLVFRIGRKGIRYLRVQDSSTVRLYFTTRKPDRPSLRWTDAAKIIRQGVPDMLDDLYVDGMVYKVFCDNPRWHREEGQKEKQKEIFNFRKLARFFEDASRLTDGTPQIVYLVGWQNEGHDSKYPFIEQVNRRLGTREELLELFKSAERNNIVLSFHDNYDDAYRDSPAWDKKIITIDPQGNLLKGRVWAGGQSYLIGHAKYIESGKAIERIEKTLSLYPIRKSYHLDVLSLTTREDFDPDHPSGSPADTLAKQAIIREFNRRGVDVTSEGITWFYRDLQHFGWHLWTLGKLLEDLPILSFIFHGRTTYGSFNNIGNRDTPQSQAEKEAIGILQGGTWDYDITGCDPIRQLCKAFYKCWVPFHALARRQMQDYVEEPYPKIIYDEQSYVELPTPETYRVVVEGTEIANERYSVHRKNSGCYLVWSERGCEHIPAEFGIETEEISILNLMTSEQKNQKAAEPLCLEPGQPLKLQF